MKRCTNSRCTQHNRPIAVKGVRFCPSCGEPVQAPDKRDGLSPLTLVIGSVFVLLILLVVTNGLDGLGGMAISTPESVPPIVSPSAERSPMLELGQLAFVRDENGQPVVYLAQTNGTRRLIEGWLPALSPDGSQVAYVSNQSGSEQLYLINTVGGSPTRLTNTPQEKLSPAWSPNTHGLLAFIGGDGILYTVKADSRGNPGPLFGSCRSQKGGGGCPHQPTWSSVK